MILPETATATADVAAHYDDLSPYYLDLWGAHVHHGLWRTGREQPEVATRQLVDEVASQAGIGSGSRVVDIGCGYGETARVLAGDYGAEVTAMTVSRAQWEYARQQTTGGNPDYVLRDWLENGLPEASFDAAISIESSEHMPDKLGFMREAWRVLRPGGRFVICAWVAKEQPRDWEVRRLLEPICSEGRLPGMGSTEEYVQWLEGQGFGDVSAVDVSKQVAKTWTICMKRAAARWCRDREFRARIADPGFPNRVFVKSLLRIRLAYATGSMKYVIVSARKPE